MKRLLLLWALLTFAVPGFLPLAHATVSTTAPRNDYIGNGATATYSYTFRIFASSDLRVTTRDTAGVETPLILTTDYTVTGVNKATGGTITLVAGNLTSGYVLTIRFDRTPQQSTDLRNQGGFFAEVHETKFDELTRYAQQNKDVLDRSLHLPETEVGTSAATRLLPASLRASKYLGFDASGNLTYYTAIISGGATVSGFAATLLDDADSAAARGTLGAVASGGGTASSLVCVSCIASADPVVALGLATKQYVDSVPQGNVTAYTGTDTLGAGVRLAKLSGASFTFSLPAAASNTSRMVTIWHNGTSLTQVYTIDPNGAETIDGTATFILYTAGERLTVISDGTNWLKLDHWAQTAWADAGAMTITGTTSNPTKATTPDYDHVFWRRDGKTAHVKWIFQVSSGAGAADGSGNYLFAMPTGIAIDAILPPVATAYATAVMSEALRSAVFGMGKVVIDSSAVDNVIPFAYDTTHLQWARDSNATAISSAAYEMTNDEFGYFLEAHFPAANWR